MNRFPDAPTVTRAEPVQESPASVANTETSFAARTVRSAAVVVAVIALLLAGTGRTALVVPFAGGAILGAVLLLGFEIVVRRSFGADDILAQKGVVLPGTQKPEKKFAGKGAILLFALIKYPLVALLIWFVTRNASVTQVAAFASGFVCLQLVIGLRGLGAFLTSPRKPLPK